jgi:hypothetical protein
MMMTVAVLMWQQMQQDMSAHGLMGLSEMDLARFDGGGMNMNMNMNMNMGDGGARGRYGRDGGMGGVGKERGRGDAMGLGEPKRSPLLEEFRTSKVRPHCHEELQQHHATDVISCIWVVYFECAYKHAEELAMNSTVAERLAHTCLDFCSLSLSTTKDSSVNFGQWANTWPCNIARMPFLNCCVSYSTLLMRAHVQVRKFELVDILEACDEFCRDQHGSRFIQVNMITLF